MHLYHSASTSALYYVSMHTAGRLNKCSVMSPFILHAARILCMWWVWIFMVIWFFFNAIHLQIPREEVDLPILTPTLDYTIACTYPPKILLTISPPSAEVGLSHSSHCKLQISGFVEKVQFTLRLRPPPHVQVMMAPLSQVNRRGLLPSQPDSEMDHSSMGKLNKGHDS